MVAEPKDSGRGDCTRSIYPEQDPYAARAQLSREREWGQHQRCWPCSPASFTAWPSMQANRRCSHSLYSSVGTTPSERIGLAIPSLAVSCAGLIPQRGDPRAGQRHRRGGKTEQCITLPGPAVDGPRSVARPERGLTSLQLKVSKTCPGLGWPASCAAHSRGNAAGARLGARGDRTRECSHHL
jgi:hypothetical protein